MQKKPIGVLISGRGSNLLSLINADIFQNAPFKVVCVISSCDAPGLEHAKKFSLPNFIVQKKDFLTKLEFEKEMSRILEIYNVELVCLAGFMIMLSPFFVKKWNKRLINIHPSLLPSFGGLNAQKQALEAKVKKSGCTVHFVDEGMDTGEIILQRIVDVMDDDSVESLSERILIAEHECYPMAIKLLIDGKHKNFDTVV